MTGIVKVFSSFFEALTDIFLQILNNSSMVIWLILAVLVLRFVIRKPKFVHCILWGLVGLKLMLPFSVESAFSLVPDSGKSVKEFFVAERPEEHPINLEISGNESQPEQETVEDRYNKETNVLLSDSKESFKVNFYNTSTVLELLLVIWFTGIGVMLTYSAVSYKKLKKKVKFAILEEENIWKSERILTPFVLGFLKPKIYLPYSLEQEDVEYVLSHEKAHIKRKDHWVKFFGFLILSVYWFHPLVWLFYILLCKDIEQACDEYVLNQMGQECKVNYASALLHCSTPGKQFGFCPISFGEISVKQRVKSILNYKKPCFWMILVAIVGILVVGICFMTSPKKSENNPGNVEGVYLGGECWYMNPLSSVMPGEMNGLRYFISEKEFRIEEVDSGNLYAIVRKPDLKWNALEDSMWEEMNQIVLNPDEMEIFDYEKRMYCKISDEYMLFFFDGTYLVGKYWNVPEADGTKENNGLWDLYELNPDENYSESSVGGANGLSAMSNGLCRGLDAYTSGDEKYSDLDNVVLQVVHDYSNIGFKYEDTFFDCEVLEVVFDEKEKDGQSISTASIYAQVLYCTVDEDNLFTEWGSINQSGAHFPVKMEFENIDNQWKCVDYWTPRDGSYFKKDIDEVFGAISKELAENGLDSQKYILAQTQSVYAQIVRSYQIETDPIIEDFLEVIMSSPKESSNPADYIAAHDIEYWELTCYGDYTYTYAKEKLSKGVKGLEKELLEMLVEELE